MLKTSEPDLRDWIACMARKEDFACYQETGEFEDRVVTVYGSEGGRKEVMRIQQYRSPEEARYAYADAMIRARGQKVKETSDD